MADVSFSSLLLRASFGAAVAALCLSCLLPSSGFAGQKKPQAHPLLRAEGSPSLAPHFAGPHAAAFSALSARQRADIREKMTIMRKNGYVELVRKISAHTKRAPALKLMFLARESGGGVNLVNPSNKTKGPLHIKAPSAAAMIRSYGGKCLALRDEETGLPLLQALDPKHFEIFLSTYRRLSSMDDNLFHRFSLSGQKDKRFASLWDNIDTLLLRAPAFSMILFDVQIPDVLQEVHERIGGDVSSLHSIPSDLVFACTWACGIDRACEVIRKGSFFKSGEGQRWLRRFPAFQSFAETHASDGDSFSPHPSSAPSCDPRASVWKRLVQLQGEKVEIRPKALF